MKPPKPVFLTTVFFIALLLSCKKDQSNDNQSKKSFFIQLSEAFYDLDIAHDQSNNYYVTSYTRTRSAGTVFDIRPDLRLQAGGDHDAYVAKFTEDGKLLWLSLLGSNSEEKGYAIAVDAKQNVFVAGTFRDFTQIGKTALQLKKLHNSSGSPNMTDMFLASLDRDGKLRWVRQISGTGFERPTSIKVSSSGKVYVTGYFYQDIYFNENRLGGSDQSGFFVAKYDQDGTLDWGKIYGGMPGVTTSFGSIYPSDLEFAPNGDLLITGSFEAQKQVGSVLLNSNGEQDVFLSRYDQNGNVIWVRTLGGRSFEHCNGLAVDNKGDIFIGGSFRDQITIGSQTFHSGIYSGASFIACYTANGSVAWVSQLGFPGAYYIYDLAENNGDLHIVGQYDAEANIGNTQLVSKTAFQGFSAVYSTSGLPKSAENLGTEGGTATQILIDTKGSKILAGTHHSPFMFGGTSYPASNGGAFFFLKQ